jgi:hypothetical protein
MAERANREWFDNCGGFSPSHNLNELRAGIEGGLLNEQDEYGMTALSCAVMSHWQIGVEELLRARADTEMRYYRTGETALYMAVLNRDEAMVRLLIAGGSNPDATNYWGLTPRRWRPEWFESLPEREKDVPEPHIQNAEHLADHHYPRFKIPSRKERESLQPGQAVDLYVYGPKGEGKGDTVKVRISARNEKDGNVRYRAIVETPIAETHLRPGTAEVELGPENVATVYLPRKSKPRNSNS